MKLVIVFHAIIVEFRFIEPRVPLKDITILPVPCCDGR